MYEIGSEISEFAIGGSTNPTALRLLFFLFFVSRSFFSLFSCEIDGSARSLLSHPKKKKKPIDPGATQEESSSAGLLKSILSRGWARGESPPLSSAIITFFLSTLMVVDQLLLRL
jgi:hypothetical protein